MLQEVDVETFARMSPSQSIKLVNRLTFAQKVRIGNFLESQKAVLENSKQSLSKVASELSVSFGFTITPKCLGRLARDLGITVFNRTTAAAKPSTNEIDQLKREVAELKRQVSDVEKQMQEVRLLSYAM